MVNVSHGLTSTKMPMADITPAPAYIRNTGTEKGLGVFAARDISVGEVVEVCPVLILDVKWDDIPRELQLRVFNWGYLTKQGAASALALGWGSMYNHANPANLRYGPLPNEQVMRFEAVRDIAVDEELTVNYQAEIGEVTSTTNRWFEQFGMKELP